MPKVASEDEDAEQTAAPAPVVEEAVEGPSTDVAEEEEEAEQPEEEEEDLVPTEEDDGNLSDAESFTLKDRQDAINVTHPFGIRIWKPALYKKDRSVQKTAEEEIHSIPGQQVNRWLLFLNQLWTLFIGWWLALICLIGAILCAMFGFMSEDALAYGRVLSGMAGYLFYPFGKFVTLVQDEAYAVEDEGEGRSISEYEQWQSGDIEEGRLFFGPLSMSMSRSLIGRRRPSVESAEETTSLLGRQRRGVRGSDILPGPKTRFFGRGKWNLGRVVFFLYFHLIITPILLLVCCFAWFFVISIPMGKVTWVVWDHMRRHPLALSFRSDSVDMRAPGEPASSVLVCTYRVVGLKYWKFTIDGTNIFLFNLLAVVAFTIFDYFVLDEMLHVENPLTNQGFIFALALFSIIPLAYFIGQAVASISAQSSMGVGATVNAFFSTVVEVFLYCVALSQGKAQLVEGSIIGSIFAGILLMPGISMCFGALKRKTQRFNVRSAGVTTTMMLFAMIGAFGPTLFYQIYGSHELRCHECKHPPPEDSVRDCRRCFFSQVPAIHDRFYTEAVLPYIWFSAAALFFGYIIGLMFTLRTHAAIIWSTDSDEKKPDHQIIQSSIHESPEALTRQATFGTIMRQDGSIRGVVSPKQGLERTFGVKSPQVQPPKLKDSDIPNLQLHGLSEADNQALRKHVAHIAATVVASAARDAGRANRKASQLPPNGKAVVVGPKAVTIAEADGTAIAPAAVVAPAAAPQGTHDAPNWSKKKSAIILLTATLAYAIIAEILVNTVDTVLNNVTIDEKFLGITLFALVPNTTEFLVSVLRVTRIF
jgi:Ca2+:H+ antiporter